MTKKQVPQKNRREDLQKQTVKDAYAKIAQSGDSVSVIGVGGDEISRYLGYSKEELRCFV